MTAAAAESLVRSHYPTARAQQLPPAEGKPARWRIVASTRAGGVRQLSHHHPSAAHAWRRAAWIICDRLAEDLRRPGRE